MRFKILALDMKIRPKVIDGTKFEPFNPIAIHVTMKKVILLEYGELNNWLQIFFNEKRISKSNEQLPGTIYNFDGTINKLFFNSHLLLHYILRQHI